MNPSKSILNYKGLFGQDDAIILPDFIHVEPLEDRSKTYNWEINEHLHSDLTQIFILKHGSGTLFSERKHRRFVAPNLITIPVNTLHGFRFEPNTDGTVVTLSESYLNHLMQNHPLVLNAFQHLSITPFHSTEELSTFNFLIDQIIQELSLPNLQNPAIAPLLQLFFIHIFRASQEQEQSAFIAKHPSLKIFHSFQTDIRRTIRETQSVATYAKGLNISTVHLNRVCHQIVGKSAIKVIHEKRIDEAKRYLIHTQYSISEVSHLLNFNDPSHFTKLFRKYVGASPTEFRRN